MSEEVLSSASALVIRELDGERAEIRLVGRALPIGSLPWGVKQRTSIVWHQGAPRASAQVLGPEFKNTTIKGKWSDKYLQTTQGYVVGTSSGTAAPATKNGQAIPNVMALCKEMERICTSGQILEVTWDQLARRGILTEFDPEIRRRQDVEWSMTFEWVGPAVDATPPIYVQETGVSDVLNQARAMQRNLDDLTELSPFALAAEFLAAVFAAMRRLESLEERLSDTVAQLADFALAPVDAARRVLSVLRTMNGRLGSTLDLVGNTAIARLTFSPEELTPGQRLAAAAWQRDVLEVVREQRDRNTQWCDGVASRIIPNSAQVYIAREGDDLRDVARLYYGGSGDDWRALLMFNSLTTSELYAGQRILVPALRATGTDAGEL